MGQAIMLALGHHRRLQLGIVPPTVSYLPIHPLISAVQAREVTEFATPAINKRCPVASLGLTRVRFPSASVWNPGSRNQVLRYNHKIAHYHFMSKE